MISLIDHCPHLGEKGLWATVIIYDMALMVGCVFADNKTRWTQHDTNTKLAVRIRSITEWKDTLSRTLSNTEEEIDKVIIGVLTICHCYCLLKYLSHP